MSRRQRCSGERKGEKRLDLCGGPHPTSCLDGRPWTTGFLTQWFALAQDLVRVGVGGLCKFCMGLGACGGQDGLEVSWVRSN